MGDIEDEGWGRTTPDRIRVRASLCSKAAEQLLKRCEVEGPPAPVDRIAKRLGFGVVIVDLPNGVDARLRVSGENRSIELATGQARVRHRFSIAHELGHAILGHRHDETEVAEQEANAFAGALLVPRAWLKDDIDTFTTVSTLSERYEVSKDVIFIATQRARLLDRLG